MAAKSHPCFHIEVGGFRWCPCWNTQSVAHTTLSGYCAVPTPVSIAPEVAPVVRVN